MNTIGYFYFNIYNYREGVFDSNKVIFVVSLKDVISKLMTDLFEW